MVLQPITDANGNVVDEFDDEQEGERITRQPVEAAPPDVIDEQKGVQQPASQSAPAPTPETSFDANDVFIGITLHRANGHPQGRLVSVCIHNYSGVPVVRVFREQELSTESRLDNLQSAIQATMQPFLVELVQRKPEQTEAKPTTPSTPRPVASGPTTRTRAGKTNPKPSEKTTKPQSHFEQVSMF